MTSSTYRGFDPLPRYSGEKMTLVISNIALFLSLAGAWLISRLCIRGYWLWIIGNIIWVYLAAERNDTSQIILFVIYTYLCFNGIKNWRKGVINGSK